jgi:preprotein translocase subunit SecD
MSPGSRTSLLRSVLGLALCAAAVAGCSEEPRPVAPRPTARMSLTLRAQPEGVFTLSVADLDGVSGDTWLENHYPRIGQKLTPANIGTGKVKDISREGQQITVRTLVEDAADCEQQAKQTRELLSDVYEDAVLVSADTRQVTSSDLDDVKQVLEARAEAAGFSDFSAEPKPPDTLVVEFACAGDPEWAKALLTDTGLLQFRMIPRRYAYDVTAVGERFWQDDTGTVVDISDVVAQSPVIVSGRDFAPASRVETRPDQDTCVTFSLRNEAREAFRLFTRDRVDTYLAIVIDGELISCPMIRSAIAGEGVLLGDFDEPGGRDKAEKLAILINSGPLALDLECVESATE